MPLTHYPKTTNNLVLAWVQPPPPDRPPPGGLPNFLGVSFSELNRWREPIAPGRTIAAFHDAQPFTRFYGSIFCDQPLEVVLAFSNEEVDADGRPISEANLGSLHYDALGTRQVYDPAKQEQTGKFFSLIFGRWICVEIKNVGERPTTATRIFLRGSVF